jgi:hypothetical protein
MGLRIPFLTEVAVDVVVTAIRDGRDQAEEGVKNAADWFDDLCDAPK